MSSTILSFHRQASVKSSRRTGIDAVTIAPCQSLALEHSRSRDGKVQEIGSEYDNLPGVIPRWLLCLALFLPAAGAYTPAVDSAGSLTIRILDPTIGNYGAGGAVTLNRAGAPFPLAVSLENHGDGPLQGVVRISVIDRWTVQPASPVSFRLKRTHLGHWSSPSRSDKVRLTRITRSTRTLNSGRTGSAWPRTR